jgi:hypothetical protein
VGHVLDQFRVGAAARNPPEPFGFLAVCRVEVSGTPIFTRAFPGCAVPDRALLPGNGRSSATFKLNQLSLACPVKRAQPPWTVDDTALMP